MNTSMYLWQQLTNIFRFNLPSNKKNPLSYAYQRYLSQNYVDKNAIRMLFSLILRKHIGAYTYCVLLIHFQTFNRLMNKKTYFIISVYL